MSSPLSRIFIFEDFRKIKFFKFTFKFYDVCLHFLDAFLDREISYRFDTCPAGTLRALIR